MPDLLTKINCWIQWNVIGTYIGISSITAVVHVENLILRHQQP